MATKYLPIDDISDDDIEKDKTDFKKYYDDFSKDLSVHKKHYSAKMADNDLTMPNIDIPSLTKTIIPPNTKEDKDLNSNNAGDHKPIKSEETLALTKHKSSKNITFSSNIAESEKPDPNSVVSLSESRMDVDQTFDEENKINLQRKKELTLSNKENARKFKSDFDTISKDTSLLLNPDKSESSKVKDSLNRDSFTDYPRVLTPISDSQENNSQEEKGLSDILKLAVEKTHKEVNVNKEHLDETNDNMDELMKNLNGKLKSLKTTKSSRKNKKLRKASMNRNSKQNRQSEYPDLDEYNDSIEEYDTLDDNGLGKGNGSASLAESESAVAKMAAIGRRPHGNNTVFEIREEGVDSVDIPASSGPWLAKIHGHRDIITTGCVVGGIGLLLILVSLITIYFNRRKERSVNKNNNRGYLKLGNAREKKHLTKEEDYSLFPITSSSEENVFSDEEEDSFVNF